MTFLCYALALAAAAPVPVAEWRAVPPGRVERCATALSPRAITCRYECICFRTNGYRCLRTYTEACEGRACWQCQDRVTRKARRSCAIGAPIRSCFCKYQLRPGDRKGRRPQSRSARRISAS